MALPGGAVTQLDRNATTTPFVFQFDDVTPPPFAVHVPDVLAQGSVSATGRLDALRRRNVRKYNQQPSSAPHTLGSHFGWNHADLDLNVERMLLCAVGSLGIGLNLILLLSLLVRRALRNMSYAFLVHGVLVDVVKAVYAILYALNIHASKDILLLPDHDEASLNGMQDAPMGNTLLGSASKWLFGAHSDRGEQTNEHVCTVIGTTYVIVVTVGIINLIAILCTETYIFTDDNLFLLRQKAPTAIHARSSNRTRPTDASHQVRQSVHDKETHSEHHRTTRDANRRRKPRTKRHKSAKESEDESESRDADPDPENDPDAQVDVLAQPHRAYSLNYCCVLFAICIIYVCSLILHLGPTIIAGQFDMNNAQDEFYCNMVTGEIRNYISYLMWLFIISLTMFGACYYASVFYRYVASYSDHRVMGLVRASVFIASGGGNAKEVHSTSEALIRLYKNRARVLIIVIIFYAVCYYPQFLLILSSRRLAHPTVLYKVFRLISLSNPIFTPAVFLTLDHQVRPAGLCDLLRRCRGRGPVQRRRQCHTAETHIQSSADNAALSTQRLFGAGGTETRNTVKADATLREVFINLDADQAVAFARRIHLDSSASDSQARLSRENSETKRKNSAEKTQWKRPAHSFDDAPLVTDRSRYTAAARDDSPLILTAAERTVTGSVRRANASLQRFAMRTMIERGSSRETEVTGDTSCRSNSLANTDVDADRTNRDNSDPATQRSGLTGNANCTRTFPSSSPNSIRLRPVSSGEPAQALVPPNQQTSGKSIPFQTGITTYATVRSVGTNSGVIVEPARRSCELPSNNLAANPTSNAGFEFASWRDSQRTSGLPASVRRREFERQASSSASASFVVETAASQQQQSDCTSASSLTERQPRQLSDAADRDSHSHDRETLERIEESLLFGNESGRAYVYGNVYEHTGISTVSTAVRRSGGTATSSTVSDSQLLSGTSIVQFRLNL